MKKPKVTLTSKEIASLSKDYETMTNKEIQEKYNISASYFRDIRYEYKLKGRGVAYLIQNKKKIKDIKSKEVICGVYIIYRNDSRKVYIGSSIDIISRIRVHISLLSNKSHHNASLIEDYEKYGWSFFVFEECLESELLKKEHDLISSLPVGVVYNKSRYNNKDLDYEEIMNSIKHRISIDESTGCWNWTGKLRNGYGVCQNSNKYLATHRVFYIAYKKEYPFIVNHKCENRLCCNPDHLEEVSSSGNTQYSMVNRKYVEESTLWPYRELIDNARKEGISYSKIVKMIDSKCSETNVRLFYGKYLDYVKSAEGVVLD